MKKALMALLAFLASIILPLTNVSAAGAAIDLRPWKKPFRPIILIILLLVAVTTTPILPTKRLFTFFVKMVARIVRSSYNSSLAIFYQTTLTNS